MSLADGTFENGNYSFTDLHAGKYTLYASGNDCIEEWYKTGGNTYFINQATQIEITPTTPAYGIDFTLEKGGSICGHVYQSNGSTPIPEARVQSSLTNTFGGFDITDSNGAFTLSGLPPGQHLVFADTTGYQREYYDNTPSSSSASKVVISGDEKVTAINFSLATGGTISGCVYQADGKIPLRFATVSTYDSGNKLLNSTTTDWNGTYQTCGLPAGSYKNLGLHWAFASRWYNNTYDQTKAVSISVTNPGDHSSINIDLETTTSPAPTELTILTESLPEGYIGTAYSQILTASGGTGSYIWSVSKGLPSGFKLNSRTGIIAGICKTKLSDLTTYKFTVKITDKSSTKLFQTKELEIKMHPPMTIVAGNPPEGAIGLLYEGWEMSVIEGTGPFIWLMKKGILPPGLSQDNTTGKITGTPSDTLKSKKKYSFTILVVDSQGKTAEKAAAIMVYPKLTISTESLPAGEINLAYKKQSLQASGGKGKYTWSLDPSLLTGMDLNNNTFSGTPTAAGVFDLIFYADDNMDNVSKEISFTVYDAPTLPAMVLDNGTVNTTCNPVQLQVTGGCGTAKSWSILKVTGYALPKGLKLNSKTGEISGKPGKAGTYTFRVKYTDKLGGTAVQDFTMIINP
jgi:hypothetical protein